MGNDDQRTDRVLITDTRAEILENYDSSNSTHRTRKYRLENSARIAFSELVEIAESGVIENPEAFPIDDVLRFVGALADYGGLEPPTVPDEYRDDLRVRLAAHATDPFLPDTDDD